MLLTDQELEEILWDTIDFKDEVLKKVLLKISEDCDSPEDIRKEVSDLSLPIDGLHIMPDTTGNIPMRMMFKNTDTGNQVSF